MPKKIYNNPIPIIRVPTLELADSRVFCLLHRKDINDRKKALRIVVLDAFCVFCHCERSEAICWIDANELENLFS